MAKVGDRQVNSNKQLIECRKVDKKGKCTSWAIIGNANKPTLQVTKLPNLSSPPVFNSVQYSRDPVTGGVGITSSNNPLSVMSAPPAPPTIIQAPAGSKMTDIVAGLTSQLIASLGKRPTIQTTAGGVPIYQLPENAQPQQGYTDAQVAAMLQEQRQYQQSGDPSYDPYKTPGKGIGEGLDGIVKWATENPMIVFGVGIGAYLLFKQPPGRR
jgi:hypothetical protein